MGDVTPSPGLLENLPERYIRSATKILQQMGKNAAALTDSARRLAERAGEGVWGRRRDA